MGINNSQREAIERLLRFRKGAEDAVVLIACAKSKLKHPAPAKDIYTSQTVRKSIQLAELFGLRYFIISAKHGLLSPNCVISPYDVTLRSFGADHASAWAREVAAVLERLSRSNQILFILGSRHYAAPLIEAINPNREIYTPIAGVPIGRMNEWLSVAVRTAQRRSVVSNVYSLLQIASSRHGLPTLQDLMARRDLPQQGVYFFFDEAEQTPYSQQLPKIVRIGTHAVSTGSKTTLRQRLRTHLGPDHGSGNHRGSVFRLHVGAALIQRDGLQKRYPNWGIGQSAVKEIRDREAPLEKQVSEYIGRLRVAVVEISDAAGPKSLRSYVERNSIAALTADEICVDPPSIGWLGSNSVKPQIRASGLWNIQHIGTALQANFTDTLEKFVCPENQLI